MSVFLSLVFVFSTIHVINGDWDPAMCHVSHYLDLGCVPVMESECCPARFDCSHLEQQSSDKCHIRDISYSIGDDVLNEVSIRTCVSCKCVANEKSEATIMCSPQVCPEHMHSISDVVAAQYTLDDQCVPNAIMQYSLIGCCSIGQIVGATEIAKLATCVLDGVTYREGQKMKPKSNKCAICICGHGFTGNIEPPFCRPLTCDVAVNDMEDVRNFCAPVYLGSAKCCPTHWRCYKDTDVVVPGPNSESILDPNMMCKYGTIQVKKGDTIIPKEKSCMVCGCHIPPLVTCVLDLECDKQIFFNILNKIKAKV